jgi:hypothetical protein
MVTRPTTMKSRAGRKAVPARRGRVMPEAEYVGKGLHFAEMHHISAAEVGARLDEVENKLYRAARRFAKAGTNSMEEVFVATTAVRRSLHEALLAVKRAARNIARQVSGAAQAAWPGADNFRAVGAKAGRRPVA